MLLGPEILLAVKRGGSAADPDPMPTADSMATLLILAVIAGGALVVLYATAAGIRNKTSDHDLKVRVASLRVDFYRRVRRGAQADEVVGVDVVEDEPARPAA